MKTQKSICLVPKLSDSPKLFSHQFPFWTFFFDPCFVFHDTEDSGRVFESRRRRDNGFGSRGRIQQHVEAFLIDYFFLDRFSYCLYRFIFFTGLVSNHATFYTFVLRSFFRWSISFHTLIVLFMIPDLIWIIIWSNIVPDR